MLFGSLVFIFYFLPALLLIYYVVPKNFRNVILLISSLVFYAWGGVSYTAILVASILFNFLFARGLKKSIRNKRAWLLIGLTFNVVVIVIFKYLDFIIENINGIGIIVSKDYSNIPLMEIILPLGISFFTFQQMSLLWDIYRDPNVKRIKLLDTALYISFFPQLIAGPIVRYNDIIQQIKHRVESIDLIRSGIQRFITGLFKKIIIANTCALIADSIMDNPVDLLSTPVAWLGIIAYAFQIYFDFSGYSDMAIGLGRMFGFKILENFNLPYISKSIKEFWRRWHISLSTWFRDYVYIPLGGNRISVKRTYVNLLIVFLLTGFWHGATWSFVLWGIFHGIFLVIEKLGFDKILKRMPSIFSWSYTCIIVLIGWVLFRIEEINDALLYIGKLFGVGDSPNIQVINYLDYERFIILLLAIIASSSTLGGIRSFISNYEDKFPTIYRIVGDSIYIIMMLISVTYINSGSYNPFIYFRF